MESQRKMVANNGYKVRLEEAIAHLPTPNARDYKDGSFPPRLWRKQDYLTNLPTWIALNLLPTPRAQNGEDRNQTIYKRQGPQNLENALALLPTPAVNDMGAGKDPNVWQEWAARQKASDGRPAPHVKSLEQEALSLGAHTAPPLSDGQPSLDDLLQPLPFDGLTATD